MDLGKRGPILQGLVCQAEEFVPYVVGNRDPSAGFKQRSMFQTYLSLRKNTMAAGPGIIVQQTKEKGRN